MHARSYFNASMFDQLTRQLAFMDETEAVQRLCNIDGIYYISFKIFVTGYFIFERQIQNGGSISQFLEFFVQELHVIPLQEIDSFPRRAIFGCLCEPSKIIPYFRRSIYDRRKFKRKPLKVNGPSKI
jgi:hypothetical protein